MTQALSIIGYGMWTATGHDGPSSVDGMQAGVSGATQSKLYDHSIGAPLSAFSVAANQWWEGESFLPELALPVIEECYSQLGKIDRREVPILMTVAPPDRPGRTAMLEQTLLSDLEARLGFELPPGSGVLAAGRTGIAQLLLNASARASEAPVHILLGVESFLTQEIVDAYMARGRLLCGANSSGFIPGEAAAAVIVAPRAGLTRPALHITGIGQGREAPEPTETAPAGTGLTSAVRSALGQAGHELFEVGSLFTDLNGEHGKFKDLMTAHIRLDRMPPEGETRRAFEGFDHWNVVETIGEVGAALGPAALGLAFEMGRMGLLQMPRILFHAAEDDGSRIALTGEFS